MIVPAVAGNGLTVIAFVEIPPSPHEFVPLTVIFPETAEVPKLTVIEFVVLVPVAPVGKVQT